MVASAFTRRRSLFPLKQRPFANPKNDLTC
jgi:hypothetical protein